jgi:hypothetical protein
LENFKGKSQLTREDIDEYFRRYESSISENAITWHIYDLRSKKIITDVKRGVYQLNNKKDFFPVPDEDVIAISDIIKRQFDPMFYNIWDTAYLNELTELQVARSTIVLEIEKGYIDSIFFEIKNEGYPETYSRLDENLVKNYVAEAKRPVIIKPFLGRGPVQLINNILVPALEKVLVDICCDELIYYTWQGHQLKEVYRNALEKYNLNFSKMLNYAKRRNRDIEIKKLLLDAAGPALKAIIE